MLKLEDTVVDLFAGARVDFRTPTRDSPGVPRSTYLAGLLARPQGKSSNDPQDLEKLSELRRILPLVPYGALKFEAKQKVHTLVGGDYLTWKEVAKIRE